MLSRIKNAQTTPATSNAELPPYVNLKTTDGKIYELLVNNKEVLTKITTRLQQPPLNMTDASAGCAAPMKEEFKIDNCFVERRRHHSPTTAEVQFYSCNNLPAVPPQTDWVPLARGNIEQFCTEPPRSGNSNDLGLGLSLGIGGALGFVALLFATGICWRKRKSNNPENAAAHLPPSYEQDNESNAVYRNI